MTRAWTGPLLALLLLPATTTAQEIRRWVDVEGRVHFGDGAAAPGSSATVSPRPGNFVGSGRPASSAAAREDEAPRSWSHAIRSEAIVPANTVRPAAPEVQAARASRPQLADASGPACQPVEYKRISPTTGHIVRMRRLPCQPDAAPVEIGPY